MKTQTQIRKRLSQVEHEMCIQAERCMKLGYESAAGLFWDRRCVERRTLRYILGLRRKPFNAADTMAGW
jgi:hypothetical protein